MSKVWESTRFAAGRGGSAACVPVGSLASGVGGAGRSLNDFTPSGSAKSNDGRPVGVCPAVGGVGSNGTASTTGGTSPVGTSSATGSDSESAAASACSRRTREYPSQPDADTLGGSVPRSPTTDSRSGVGVTVGRPTTESRFGVGVAVTGGCEENTSEAGSTAGSSRSATAGVPPANEPGSAVRISGGGNRLAISDTLDGLASEGVRAAAGGRTNEPESAAEGAAGASRPSANELAGSAVGYSVAMSGTLTMPDDGSAVGSSGNSGRFARSSTSSPSVNDDGSDVGTGRA